MAMSMLQATDLHQSQAKKTDRKTDVGFVVFICVALGIAVASVALNRPAIGSGISNDTVYVGP
jgi:hypothetical protein